MSEPKLISPLLDNFIIGDPISDHNGVRCCPAITKDTGDKYIVKIISIPSSQTKLEALLLTGAYPDAQAALAYFKELSEDVITEAKVLQKLSQLEGFVSYENWQIVPMEDGTGYDVYLLSPYRATLERQLKRNVMTNLGAINLGIDLCSALAVCRQTGYLFVDLKPSNVLINENKQYLIGDLGFIKLSALKFASLQDKYRSAYTAPEIEDAFSDLNTTLDVYAIGMILYQVFNGGELPIASEDAQEAMPAPMYADYEMAEIIAKACAADPAQRWQTPEQMGQALVSYMQRNGANDTPIIPAAEEDMTADLVDTAEEAAGAFEKTEDPETEVESTADEIPEQIAEADIYTEDDAGNLTFLEEMTDDDTAPDAEDVDVAYEEVTEEVSDILEQADDLIAHETPDPVIAPDPIDVPIPPPLYVKEEAAEEPEAAEAEQTEEPIPEVEETEEQTQEQVDPEEENLDDAYLYEEAIPDPAKKKRASKLLITMVIIISVITGLVLGGLWYYKNIYQQTVSEITLFGDEDMLTIYLTSDIPDEKLTVICSDIYGNKLTAPVVDGVANFTNLAADKAYAIKVEIDGFHQLIGAVSASYNTPAITNITAFTAITGTEDGSVILNFESDGPDSKNWIVFYSTADEEEKKLEFTGHSVTLYDLTVGAEYNFKLVPVTKLYVTGTDEIRFTARNVVIAEDVTITYCGGGKLSAAWSVPEGAVVDSWTVRYICNDGSEGSVTTAETSVTFEDLDTTLGYTVEVTADGMSLSQRANVMANTITITNFNATANGSTLTLNWESSIPIGEGGWLLQYSVDGSETKYTVPCSANSATIKPIAPGATYTFTLEAAAGNQVLCGSASYTADKAGSFNAFGATAQRMTFSMCKRPSKSNWTRKDLKTADYTTNFKVGNKASFLVRLSGKYNISTAAVEVLYVIRTADGEFVSANAVSTAWNKMFSNGYCSLDIPSLPNTTGSYNITVYFNGAVAGSQNFTMTA